MSNTLTRRCPRDPPSLTAAPSARRPSACRGLHRALSLLSVPEIARVVGEKAATIEKRLHWALEKLRDELPSGQVVG